MSIIKFDPNAGFWTEEGANMEPVAAVGDYLKQGSTANQQWNSVHLGLAQDGEGATLYLSQVEPLSPFKSHVAVVVTR